MFENPSATNIPKGGQAAKPHPLQKTSACPFWLLAFPARSLARSAAKTRPFLMALLHRPQGEETPKAAAAAEGGPARHRRIAAASTALVA